MNALTNYTMQIVISSVIDEENVKYLFEEKIKVLTLHEDKNLIFFAKIKLGVINSLFPKLVDAKKFVNFIKS